MRAYSTLLGILCLQDYRRNLALACKRGMVIVSAELGSKESHEIGPCSFKSLVRMSPLIRLLLVEAMDPNSGVDCLKVVEDRSGCLTADSPGEKRNI